MTYDEVTEAFSQILEQKEMSDANFAVLERFTVLLYDRTNRSGSVNEARKFLFSQKGRQIENIPPSQAALHQHIPRAVYQAAFVWNQCLSPQMVLPDPGNWGWTNSDKWEPLWTTLPEANVACRELISCGCLKGCLGWCKCRKAALHCTALCKCNAECDS